MLPSMYSAISGLKAQQQKLNVIGNNIANSTTTAYKSQNAIFEDMMSQSLSGGSSPSNSTGGVNPEQVGLGVQVAGIETNTTTGDLQPTNNPLDCAISDKGYFIVGSGPLPDPATSTDGMDDGTAGAIGQADESKHAISSANGINVSFTRDGSFGLDNQGNLHTANGLRVYGYSNKSAKINYSSDKDTQHTVTVTKESDGTVKTDLNGSALVPMVIPNSVMIGTTPYAVKTVSIQQTGFITATLSDGTNVVLGQIAMAKFNNDAGLEKSGNNLYSTSPSSGQPILRNREGADAANVNSGGYGDVLSNRLEASNVDLAEQFSDMIVASRAFEANGKIITTDDSILETLVNLKR